MDPDPAIFVIDLQEIYFVKVYLHHFSKIKGQKESQNSRNQGFSYYFCMMIEGSGRLKNMWRIRIRIHNTDGKILIVLVHAARCVVVNGPVCRPLPGGGGEADTLLRGRVPP
jgi:hypothetical protein